MTDAGLWGFGPTFNSLVLFSSSFIVVFFLGLQSLFVNSGRRGLAFVTSFCIGASQLFMYKLVPGAEGFEVVAFLCGGPFGIVSAMFVFDILKRGKNEGRKN